MCCHAVICTVEIYKFWQALLYNLKQIFFLKNKLLQMYNFGKKMGTIF